jgi:hypothetical protein
MDNALDGKTLNRPDGKARRDEYSTYGTLEAIG